ncbi:MAG TPA: hypothetical protein VFD94_04205 [Jatrophihabitans sp.]|nr:hypothetical protein [Jatrophihabitans sp.]
MSRFRPVSPPLLADELVAGPLARQQRPHPLRVGLDAPACADLDPLLALLGDRLRSAGRPLAIVPARLFYRDASLRWEYGKADVDSFYRGWLDTAALQREVLQPLAVDGSYLPSLRDPGSNRSTRAAPVRLPPAGVALVTGELLLGHGLDFDVVVHVSVSRQARRRQTPAELQWTLPAHDRYELEVDPVGLADVVVRYDDPAHPALLVRAAPS